MKDLFSPVFERKLLDSLKPFRTTKLGDNEFCNDNFDKEKNILRIDMPGVKKEDIVIDCEGVNLIIEGNRNDKDFTYTRRYILSPGINTDAISAKLVDGVLEILLPIKESSKNKKIAIE